MPNVLDIRRRIRSVTNTRQITKAMKMVSAAKLRRAQERALAARPYAQMLTNVLKSLVSRAEIYDPETGEPKHPLLAARPENNILFLVVTGDKGLAGAFNTNILKAAAKFLVHRIGQEHRSRSHRTQRPRLPSPPLLHRGTSKADSTGSPRTTIVGEHIGVLTKVEYEMVGEMAERIIERYTREEIDSVYIVYNEFKSVIAQRLVVEKILPIGEVGKAGIAQSDEMTQEEKKHAIEASKGAGVSVRAADTSAIDEAASHFATAQVDYIYEQPAEELFKSLLPKYVAIQIFRGLLESVAAEHAARMTAMEAATSNATDMIDSLTLVMNRARQAKITKEIIEIVSGAAAMN